MSTLVIVLRTVSLLAFAGPMLLGVSGRHGEPKTRAIQEGGGRAPVVANLSAFGLFFPSLLIFSGSSAASMALPLALSGCLLALAGAALVLRSRAQLGPAWSFVPKADEGTGLVTTGPPIASCATPSTWASHCSPWAKNSPSAAGLPS
jgi:protein-S-isoprenylcysteine O-methyltransferase Ste14